MILDDFVHVDRNVFFVKGVKRNPATIARLDGNFELGQLKFVILHTKSLSVKMKEYLAEAQITMQLKLRNVHQKHSLCSFIIGEDKSPTLLFPIR